MISVQTILKGLHDVVNFSDLCRLCGHKKSSTISLFDTSFQTSLYNIINFHFQDIQVSQNDSLPVKLCDDCTKLILSWHRFYNTCVQVNEALLSVVDKFQIKSDAVEFNTESRSDIEVIEVDVESDSHDLDSYDILDNIDKPSDKLPENNAECVTGNFLFVDTNTTLIGNTDKIIVTTKSTPLSLLPPSTSINKDSRSEVDSGAAGTTKCKICGSVFLKSKIDSSKNRGMCYTCYSKKTKVALSLPKIFQNYLVTDENKQSYFVCDLCEFSCDDCPDVFAHHYKTNHPRANSFQNFANVKDDPMEKFAQEKNGIRWYRCDRCKMSFISRNVFAEHYAEHGDQILQTGTLNIEFKDDKFCCSICQKSFAQLEPAKRHLKRNHGPKNYFCGVCQKGFSYKHCALEHEKLHLKSKNFMCDLCGFKFITKTTLKTHIDNKLCSKYVCAWCNRIFYEKITLDNHLNNCMQNERNATAGAKIQKPDQQRDQIGTSEGADVAKIQRKSALPTSRLVPDWLMKYECAKCNKKFKSKLSLRIHIVEEFKLTPYKCVICDQQFATTPLLNKHLLSCNKTILNNSSGDDFSLILNHGDSFSCKLCGRKCRKIGYLRQHFKLHSKVQPYVCQFCGKSYVMKASFRAHMLTERNQRKYACSICEKRYNTSSHLTAHIKKHHRLREFKCTSCDKEFAYERDLKEHEKTHDEAKLFCCDKCGGFFKTAKYLKVHLEKCEGWKRKLK